jgi:predicted amidophosphoribosyltransferase
VAWVPADPARRRRRGWHLPELFARELVALEHARVARPLVTRVRRTTPQRGSGRQQRLDNVRGAFAAAAAPPARVLLVDDVHTTGATLAEARRVLTAAGHAVDVLAITSVARHARKMQ